MENIRNSLIPSKVRESQIKETQMIDIDLLIFDLDGTLVDSKEGIVNSVNFTLSKLGLGRKPFDEIVSFVGTGVNDLIKKSLGEENISLFEKGISIFENHYKTHSAVRCRLYPHVKDVLENFKLKLMFVVTNRRKNMAQVTLSSLKIGKYFKDIIGGDDRHCLKPSVCSLSGALKWSKDKRRSMIVGDMDLDVLTGKRAGTITCAVTYGIGKREDIVKAKPDYIIDDILELEAIAR